MAKQKDFGLSNNNGQDEMNQSTGEHRPGRLAQFKNSSLEGEKYPTQYENESNDQDE